MSFEWKPAGSVDGWFFFNIIIITVSFGRVGTKICGSPSASIHLHLHQSVVKPQAVVWNQIVVQFGRNFYPMLTVWLDKFFCFMELVLYCRCKVSSVLFMLWSAKCPNLWFKVENQVTDSRASQYNSAFGEAIMQMAQVCSNTDRQLGLSLS